LTPDIEPSHIFSKRFIELVFQKSLTHLKIETIDECTFITPLTFPDIDNVFYYGFLTHNDRQMVYLNGVRIGADNFSDSVPKLFDYVVNYNAFAQFLGYRIQTTGLINTLQ